MKQLGVFGIMILIIITTIIGCYQEKSPLPDNNATLSITSEKFASVIYDEESTVSRISTSEEETAVSKIQTNSNISPKSSELEKTSIFNSSTDNISTLLKSRGEIKTFAQKQPLNATILTDYKPTFTWTLAENADCYTLLIEKYYDDSNTYKVNYKMEGITGNSMKLTMSLTPNSTYRWKIFAQNQTNEEQAEGNNGLLGNIFISPTNASAHPANVGLNFTFKNIITETVLRNYLSRSMNISGMFNDSSTETRDDLRMIYNTGAKYIARSDCSWAPNSIEYNHYSEVESLLAEAHTVDPELMFEACIFENITIDINKISIPEWVFTAYGLTPADRCFNFDNMRFADGTFLDRFGTGTAVPDITRIDTQMFFYYRACTYIDLGYEALHMGQVHLIGAHDSNWGCWTNVMNKIRNYALEHARRGFVMINAHTHGIIGSDGKLLFDCHGYPMRGISTIGAVSHIPSTNNPQDIKLTVGYSDSIYGKSLGGKTYSGWSCDSLPYYVELDNWDGYGKDWVDKPSTGDNLYWWGFDEISWFANQTEAFRASWLTYAYNWVNNTDMAGYAQMPGKRTAALRSGNGLMTIRQLTYNAHSSIFTTYGFNDEYSIRKIWVSSR